MATCCVLSKPLSLNIEKTITTYVGGSPAVPAQPARCVTTTKSEQVLEASSYYEVCQETNSASLVTGFPVNSTQRVCRQYPTNYQYTTKTKTETTCYPATPAIPAVPPTPITYNILSLILNEGWNSWSRSIQPLLVNKALHIKIPYGIRGCFVGLSTVSSTPPSIGAFNWGCVFDLTGVKVFENGNIVHTLTNTYNSSTPLQIARLLSNKILYRYGNQSFQSNNIADPNDILYVWVFLYASNDTVECASFQDSVSSLFYDVNFVGKANINLLYRVGNKYIIYSELKGTAKIDTYDYVNYVIKASSKIAVTLEDIINSKLPSIVGLVRETGATVSFINAKLPSIQVQGSFLAFIPALPQIIFAVLPYMSFYGSATEIHFCTANLVSPSVKAICSEVPYSFGYAVLPSFRAFVDGIDRDYLIIISRLIGFSFHFSDYERLSIFMSKLIIDSEYYTSILSQLFFTDSVKAQSILNYYLDLLVSFVSKIYVKSIFKDYVPGVKKVPDKTQTWTVNLDSMAYSQYENYSFNSFLVNKGICYGVKQDGVYKLYGNNDDGDEIQSLIELASDSLIDNFKKSIQAIYVSAVSNDTLIVKLQVDGGDTYEYECVRHNSAPDVQKVSTGKGAFGNVWRIKLLNKNGNYFEVNKVEILPVAVYRRGL